MSLIPKKIYQSWKTKNLSSSLQKNVDIIKQLNPDYEYFLYDDNDCREFLFQHFGQNYVNAFDSLIPGAFKCDFWRYAMLYIEGGVYLDMDMTPLVPFDELIKPNDEFISIVDQKFAFNPHCGIYQAFIACKPRHPALLYALQISFVNIVTRRDEISEMLSVTGPIVMGLALNLFWNNKVTHAPIEPGNYPGVTILPVDHSKGYVYDFKGKEIFKTKFDGYQPITNYGKMNFYTDDPRVYKRWLLKWGVIIIFLIACLSLFFVYKYRKKFKVCEYTFNNNHK
jgi:hypothetical protein